MKFTFENLIELAKAQGVQCRHTFSYFYELKFQDGSIYDGNIDDCMKKLGPRY